MFTYGKENRVSHIGIRIFLASIIFDVNPISLAKLFDVKEFVFLCLVEELRSKSCLLDTCYINIPAHLSCHYLRRQFQYNLTNITWPHLTTNLTYMPVKLIEEHHVCLSSFLMWKWKFWVFFDLFFFSSWRFDFRMLLNFYIPDARWPTVLSRSFPVYSPFGYPPLCLPQGLFHISAEIALSERKFFMIVSRV